MRPTFAVALCAILIAGPTAAIAQETDDWEFQSDPSRNLTVAVARYDSGLAVIAQCRDAALTTALIGMPAGTRPFEVMAQRADGRADTQSWAPGAAPGIFVSTVAARDIRFMRGGGLYSIHTAEGAPVAIRASFDLPTQSANLDRVLSACGWGLTDERDLLTRARRGEVSFRDPDAPPPRSRPQGRGARAGQPAPPPPPAEPVVPGLPPAETQISCVLRDMELTDCRFDHPARVSGAEVTRALRRLEGTKMYPLNGAEPEGKVVFSVGPLIAVAGPEPVS